VNVVIAMSIVFGLFFLPGCQSETLNDYFYSIESYLDHKTISEGRPLPNELKASKPVNCCLCQRDPYATNALFPLFTDKDNCAEKSIGAYHECRKITLTEGECSLVQAKRVAGSITCKPLVRYYLENGIKKEISPPEVSLSEGVCNPAVVQMVKGEKEERLKTQGLEPGFEGVIPY
jgi:hypothetical protein